MGTYKQELAFWVRHFRETKDRSMKVWLRSEKLSRFISSTEDFESGKLGISIIDHFGGREPCLVNYDCVVKGGTAVKLIPTIILDSHLVTYLTRYLKRPSFATVDEHQITRKFLERMVEIGCDYNPTFYYLESVITNGPEVARRYAVVTAVTMLRFHSMNEELFMQNDLVVPDEASVERYARRYGVTFTDPNDAIERIAPIMADQMITNFSGPVYEHLEGMFYYTYAVLLKMVLIHRSSNERVEKKMNALRDFMEDEFNLVLARENCMAAYYFSNRLPAKFMAVDSQMSFTEVRSRFLASARDFFLLRIPEAHLGSGDEEETSYSFVATAEHAVRKIGRVFTIEHAISLSPERYPAIHLTFDLTELSRELGPEVINKIINLQGQRAIARQEQSLLSSREVISSEALRKMVDSLEYQIKGYCKKV
jgi:hypothetical protein